MKCRNVFGATGLLLFIFAIDAKTQTFCDEPLLRPAVLAPEIKKSDLKIEVAPPPPTRKNTKAIPIAASYSQEKQFLILSAGVYGAALADMHQTLEQSKNSWWYEADPLARPFVRLPAPAYYATGLALATGLNWISWKMAHSRKWHRLAAVPQLLSIGGNTYGFKSNLYR